MNSHLLIAILHLVILSRASTTEACNFQLCIDNYDEATSYIGQDDPGPGYCIILRTYVNCLKHQKRPCRGDLYYHTTVSLTNSWMKEHNCSAEGPTYQLEGEPHEGEPENAYGLPFPLPDSQTATMQSDAGLVRHAEESCLFYHGERLLNYCSFFGDPHLITLNENEETCRVDGAWPLIDNYYIAVQATSELVSNEHGATAITQLTVMIKGSTHCSEQKTYEAFAGNLPLAFVDGSHRSGPAEMLHHTELVSGEYPLEIVEIEHEKRVDILIRYISTRIIIRQVGKFLTFSISIPREVALKQTEDVAKYPRMQLCSDGCPASEKINVWRAMRSSKKLNPRSVSSAITFCRKLGLTDFPLDACVFDMVSAGGNRDFADAALMALSDMMELNANYATKFQNKTDLRVYGFPDSDSFTRNFSVHLRSTPFAIVFMLVSLVFFHLVADIRWWQ